MTLLLTNKDVEQATNIKTQIDSIEKGLLEEANNAVDLPPRLNLATTSGFFRVMPAVMRDSGLMGYKVFHGSIQQGVRYLIAVYNEKDGILLSLMDAAYLTAARTGATTGVATKYMAPPAAKTVGVIGSGLEATTNLQAVCVVRPIEEGKVFSPTPANRERFARRMGDKLGINLTAVDTPEQAVKDVDTVVVATNTTGVGDLIAYRGKWMQTGGHVNSIGSTGLQLREIDAETFRRAERIVVDSRVQMEGESGDLKAALDAGSYDRSKVTELKEVVAGRTKGRSGLDEITLFKSVGTAIQDVAAGFAVYKEAVRQGLGQDVGEFLELKTF